MIEKLQKGADAAFDKWVEENYSKEILIESIEGIAVRGFFKMSISTESSANFSEERNMFIASYKFFDYVKSTLPDFNVYKETETVKRYNLLKNNHYDVNVEYIIVDWSRVNTPKSNDNKVERLSDEQFMERTRQWFIDRNMQDADPAVQLLKLFEEFGELCAAYVRNKTDDVIDAIGDMFVVIEGMYLMIENEHPTYVTSPEVIMLLTLADTLTSIGDDILNNASFVETTKSLNHGVEMIGATAYVLEIDVNTAKSVAYHEIKDRKGKLINGVFVKEEKSNVENK